MDSMLVRAFGSHLYRNNEEHSLDRGKMSPWSGRIRCHRLQAKSPENKSYDWSLLAAVYLLLYLQTPMSWASECVRPVHSVAVERVAMTRPAQYRYASQVFVHCTDIWSGEGCYRVVNSSHLGFGETCSLSWVSIFRAAQGINMSSTL